MGINIHCKNADALPINILKAVWKFYFKQLNTQAEISSLSSLQYPPQTVRNTLKDFKNAKIEL